MKEKIRKLESALLAAQRRAFEQERKIKAVESALQVSQFEVLEWRQRFDKLLAVMDHGR